MKYFSMFSGIGGFELGIEQAAQDLGITAECVGYSEIEPHAIEIYERHYPGHDNYGDATTINAESLPDFDLLVGGFPCQAFSVAGKRQGFEESRGTLFFDIARILKAKQPKYFILENVKGLIGHNGGRTFRTIINTLDELGYMGQWQVLNSKDHGVPHSRERTYIVGHHGSVPAPEVFPFLRGRGPNLRELTKGVPSYFRVYEPVLARTQMALGGGGGALTGYYLDRNTGKDPRHSVRVLTPVESERLQGFPDNWTHGTDTQRKRRCGNAVTVNVVKDVSLRLLAGFVMPTRVLEITRKEQ
jgi:DNA (cytosine-5)-methyltransferase 1